jgi:hypothetical protein
VGRLWHWAGIACAPSLVVGATEEALRTAAQALDQRQGTVWAGDHRDGEHHSGRHVRWDLSYLTCLPASYPTPYLTSSGGTSCGC